MKTIKRAIGTLLRDAIGLAGMGSVSYGAWLVYPPAGFITGGVLMLSAACLLARAEAYD